MSILSSSERDGMKTYTQEELEASVAAWKEQAQNVLMTALAEAHKAGSLATAVSALNYVIGEVEALPANDAALTTLLRRERLEEAHQWLMSEGLDKESRLKWKRERIAHLEAGSAEVEKDGS